jgi:hypothetical protein
MKRLVAAMLLCLIPPFVQAEEASRQPERLPELLWSIDLSGNPDFNASRSLAVSESPAELSFISDESIALLFGSGKGRADKLEAIFVQARTGRTIANLSWENPRGSWRLISTKAGEFVVSTGTALYRYSSTRQLLQSRPVAEPDKTELFRSPSGKWLLLRDFVGPARFRLTIIDTENLANESVLGWNGFLTVGVSDDRETLENVFNWGGPSGRENVSLCNQAHDCRILYPHSAAGAWFVDNDAVLVEGERKWVVLQRPGKVTFERKLPSPEGIIGRTSVSPQSREVAFETGYIGRSWVYRVHVFDVEHAKYVHLFEFKKKPTMGWDSGYGDFTQALSPDGSRIAILRGSTLELYRIRAGQIAAHQ